MIINAPCGKLEGKELGELHQFLGIPYAKPPVGAHRFLPPEPAERWEGVRDAKHLGHAAPQLYVPGLSALTDEETLDEDCLYLNVTTPDAKGRLPVLFWVHGGAFQKGSGTLLIDPPAFARSGMVVVSANYRIGALGFMDMSGYLGPEYKQSGNDGILDIIQALTWVKENIASFGGDPDNVTIMGQSAGSKICSTLTIMKKAKGLFQKAVCCSGGIQCIRSVKTAHAIADQFAKEADITHENADRLLTMPWEEILKAQTNIFAGLNLHTVGPVFDGINFDENDALELTRKGTAKDIKILLGTNRDEMNLYWTVYNVHEMDEKLAVKLFGNRAPIVLKAFSRLDKTAPDYQEQFVHLFTEYVYRAGAVRMAEAAALGGQEVYLYQLDWDRHPLKACHTSETQFLMGKAGLLKTVEHTPEHEKLVQEMHDSFLNFMKTGTPEAEGMPKWPCFTAEDKKEMVFDAPCHVETAPAVSTDPQMPFCVFELD